MELFASLFAIVAILTLVVSVVGSLVCFVLVLIQMFRRDQQTLALVCIVLSFLTGLGTIVAFIFGWTKAAEWQIKKTMLAWTVCLILQLVGVVLMIFVLISFSHVHMKAVHEAIQEVDELPRQRIELQNY